MLKVSNLADCQSRIELGASKLILDHVIKFCYNEYYRTHKSW